MSTTRHHSPIQGIPERCGLVSAFLPHFNGVFLIHEDTRVPIPLYVDMSISGRVAVINTVAYHVEFPPHIVQQRLSICHLEDLNAMVEV